MKKYIVKALSCAVRKKIYYKGETISASLFDKGVAEKLVEKNFLEEVIEEITTSAGNGGGQESTDDPDKGHESDLNTSVSRETDLDGANTSIHSDAPGGNQEAGEGKETESTDDAGTANSDEKKGGDGIESISLTQLRKQLRERGVKFSNDAEKKDLYALWLLK